ncbi:Hpt domain-containing protein [Vibrio sp. D173a]|uniref:Hpt domain-containing protein n=1 Tax=Vibrio sp. D173a TaxID=2836349 RepID=UPI00255759DB|nr:Hpt domain-containing protein [Vibrio sp. D173a]MDK9754699.1 Hpt domain-containing protein [Vibrio sp. D173a]
MLQFKEGIRRSAWFLFAAWCVFAVSIWLQAQQTIRTISTVDELSSKIDEVRNIFNFELPYRAQHVDEVSLKLQLVYAVRLQLESEHSHLLGAPDLTQLFYLTDRFLEGARTFIGSDSELVALADQLHNSRESGSNSLELRTMYYRLGAMVLEAMFSDAATSTDTYQELDLLFTASQGLDVKELASFQRRLDQTSSVLAAHAQGSHLSNQLLNPELPNQLASVIGSLERKLTFYITCLTLVSGSLLAAYSWAVFAKKVPTSQSALTSVQEKGETSHPSPVVSGFEERKPAFVGQNEQETHADFLCPKEQNVMQPSVESVHTEDDALSINEPYIDIQKMLDSLSDDEDSVRMLLEVFIQDHTEDGIKLRVLVTEEKDKDQAQRIAHSLKGVSGSIGAMPLHYISGDIESLIKQGERVTDDKLDLLEQVLQETTLFADKVLNSENIREVLTD